MSNPFFRFKQFTVYHDQCAMKVGTDGVLLGAWTEAGQSKHILDVGTGTGLIALMMAQRNPGARVTAIDIDRKAVAQAKKNADNSTFADRMTVELRDFRDYASLWQERFDLIVSNPPWFENSLLPPDAGRTTARHSVSLTLQELLCTAKCCLKQDGLLALILPFDKRQELKQLSDKLGFFLKRETVVFPLPDSAPKRLLTEWVLTPVGNPLRNRLTIEQSHHQYSPEFVDLLHEFYLYL
ncbi:tRNA1(Val) (adenine(37)-N6)-methyltransferase [Proteiniphilum sp. UBA5510]|mgnify:FL=1|jgi:tRNA1Val (adenine37-N6)-methyltransferase|uniref:tRNA1(Val) (adenine(37)-N6)-methyltransferase n=1 Tax=Proteiniphilum sp. UBA5510 TaxID=1947286 RepID=UPI00257C06D8|nr:methyltransferase [Proteiniphilum sp. UBA5510]MDD4632278.1 methyltransferase [Proteiniphilum sp.]